MYKFKLFLYSDCLNIDVIKRKITSNFQYKKWSEKSILKYMYSIDSSLEFLLLYFDLVFRRNIYPEFSVIYDRNDHKTQFSVVTEKQCLAREWTVPHFVLKCTNLPLLLFYRFLFILGSTVHKLYHKQKAHVLLCKAGQR